MGNVSKMHLRSGLGPEPPSGSLQRSPRPLSWCGGARYTSPRTLPSSWPSASNFDRLFEPHEWVPVRHSEGPPFWKVRHSESRHSWSLHGTVIDIATTRRLTLTLTLTVSLTVSCHCWKWMKTADPSEWRPLRMAGRHPRVHPQDKFLATPLHAVAEILSSV